MAETVRPEPVDRDWARWDVFVVIGAGGALGTLARYGVSVWLPHAAGEFPWSTLLVNVIGCVVIGGFMVVIDETAFSHRLLRPFVGVGVLGGFTTFSTYAVDVVALVMADQPRPALLYLTGTVLTALGAVVAGVVGMRGMLRLVTRCWTTARQRAEGGQPR